MTERQLQFQVGLFVLLAFGVAAALIILFSDLKSYWQPTYAVAVHFDEAPGIQPGSPVRQNGIPIGKVRRVSLDEEQGGVLVVVEIREPHRLRIDTQPALVRSIFGDSRITFTSGRADEFIPPNSRLKGVSPADPMEVVQRLETGVNTALGTFTDTSREWQLVGRNLNQLMDTKEGHLDDVIERTATALETFNRTMQAATRTLEQAGTTIEVASTTLANANDLITDPELQRDLRQAAAALPTVVEEARLTVTTARRSIESINSNLETIQQATEPLATESDVIVRKLSGSLIQLESLLTELNRFSKLVNSEEGSLQKFASDPDLYRNLNRSALALSVLLDNLGPALKDMRIFADKIARHPELLGVSGAVRGSSGIKEPDEILPAGYNSRPANAGPASR
jgi:phospholipid/cholesterol/gamma-HCH transport system substrate-binding protein